MKLLISSLVFLTVFLSSCSTTGASKSDGYVLIRKGQKVSCKDIIQKRTETILVTCDSDWYAYSCLRESSGVFSSCEEVILFSK